MSAYASLDGDFIQVYVNGVVIANGTDCKISFKRANRETTTKDGGNNEQYEYTKGGWSVSGGYLHSEVAPLGTPNLFDIWLNRTKATIKFGSVTSGQIYYSGTALLESLDLSGPQKDNVTGSYSFKGDGAASRTTNP